MALNDSRLVMRVRPASAVRPELEVVVLGHCPGQARWQYLAENAQTLRDIAMLGFHREVETLRTWQRQWQQSGVVPKPASASEQALQDLYLLPIPIVSLAHFQVLFPDAERESAVYRSQLASGKST